MIRLSLLLMALALPLRAEIYPALHDVTGVAADDVLNIRASASAEAPVIGTLAPDATGVEVVAVQDGWAVVNTGEGSGFAAMRFLTRTDTPDWNALQTPLTCLGTEPFWSLQIDPDAGLTSYRSPELPEPLQSAMTEVWPGGAWSQTAALSVPHGIAVLQPMECSDGMSDRSYGIAVDIFLFGQDSARLSGCCHLGPP